MAADDQSSVASRSLSALAATLIDDNAMASAAITGESRIPNMGWSTPAAIGTLGAL